MWNGEMCSQLPPSWTLYRPRCCHGPWCPCRGPMCGFHSCALQSSIHYMQVSLDASEPALAYVPGKYPYLKMPPVHSTNLTFNMPVFQKGVKESSVDEQKPWNEVYKSRITIPTLPSHRPGKQSRPTIRVQAVACHGWYDSAIQARAKDSQPHGTHIQNWPSITVESDASQPR
ncbi:hypothetical protein MTO96_015972 [Rhipicephalus appendiculatus]